MISFFKVVIRFQYFLILTNMRSLNLKDNSSLTFDECHNFTFDFISFQKKFRDSYEVLVLGLFFEINIKLFYIL